MARMVDSHGRRAVTTMQRRGGKRQQTLLLICTFYCHGGITAAKSSHYLRHGSNSGRQTTRRIYQLNSDVALSQFDCPPSHSGYYPTPGCGQYYWCDYGAQSSAIIYRCTDGLLFDEALQVCNWKEGVTCSLKTSEPTEHPTISPTLRPTEPPPTKSPIVMPTAAPNQYTFQKKTLPHGKEMIGYWHGNTQRASTMTPNQIDYSKLSRINYATFTTNENGKIYIRGKKNGSLNNDAEIITLLGPYVWYPPNDGSLKEFCTSNPNNDNGGCMHHDYQQGMLHLAHLSGVEVYPSITLDTDQSLLKLDEEEFTKNATQLWKIASLMDWTFTLKIQRKEDRKMRRRLFSRYFLSSSIWIGQTHVQTQ